MGRLWEFFLRIIEPLAGAVSIFGVIQTRELLISS
jgi:hypothetical protein